MKTDYKDELIEILKKAFYDVTELAKNHNEISNSSISVHGAIVGEIRGKLHDALNGAIIIKDPNAKVQSILF